MKLSAWHKKQGDIVEFNNYLCNPDKVYASCIFTENAYKIKQLPFENVVAGGSGLQNWDMVLPDKIEHIMPDYSLYNSDYSLGFTTRGCIRKCPWCIVPDKEGKIRAMADIYEFWDRKYGKIVLLDNNILALPEHFKKITRQILKENLITEFNQGLDIRLLTLESAKILKKIKLSELWFAWDNIKEERIIFQGLKILKKAKIKNFRFYVLVGFNSTFEEDLYRFNILKKINQKNKLNIRPYCMRYEKVKKEAKYIRLAEWVNMPRFWAKMDFSEFLRLQQEYRQNYKEGEYAEKRGQIKINIGD